MTHKDHKRIHLVLSNKEAETLAKVAHAESLSVSWLVRHAIRQWLKGLNDWAARSSTKSVPTPLMHKDPFLSVIGSFKKGGLTSKKIDDELYGS